MSKLIPCLPPQQLKKIKQIIFNSQHRDNLARWKIRPIKSVLLLGGKNGAARAAAKEIAIPLGFSYAERNPCCLRDAEVVSKIVYFIEYSAQPPHIETIMQANDFVHTRDCPALFICSIPQQEVSQSLVRVFDDVIRWDWFTEKPN